MLQIKTREVRTCDQARSWCVLFVFWGPGPVDICTPTKPPQPNPLPNASQPTNPTRQPTNTQLQALERRAMGKLMRALEPNMADVLACARDAEDRDRQVRASFCALFWGG